MVYCSVLRIVFDPALKDALYDSLTMRNFVGIDLGRKPAPSETTVCRFRDLPEQHGISREMLTAVNGHLARPGWKIGTGTIVVATILAALS